MYRLKVKEIAISKGFSQSKLSRASDLSFTTIRRVWHNPQHEVSVSVLHKIAQALGVTTNDLIEDVDESSQ